MGRSAKASVTRRSSASASVRAGTPASTPSARPASSRAPANSSTRTLTSAAASAASSRADSDAGGTLRAHRLHLVIPTQLRNYQGRQVELGLSSLAAWQRLPPHFGTANPPVIGVRLAQPVPSSAQPVPSHEIEIAREWEGSAKDSEERGRGDRRPGRA